VPIVRYVCLVGPFLLGMLFLLGEPDKPASVFAPDRWTAVDSLRAMAHLGEQVEGHAETARFVRRAVSESANHNPIAESATQEKPPIMNAQAKMDLTEISSQRANKQAGIAKPRKQSVAARQVRVHTAVAESTQRISSGFFPPPSW
jgi:hypothetical protein